MRACYSSALAGEVSERSKEHDWKSCIRYAYRGFESLPLRHVCYGGLVGPFAMIQCKPRQARKGAAVASDSCAKLGGRRPPPYLEAQNP
jgi:hypothetical protein